MKKFFIVTAAISFLILGSLCLSACQKLEAAEPHSLSEWMELVTDEELDRLELVSNSSEIDSEGLYLVASVPEENCYLYCYQPGGELFFRFRGKRSLIEEKYMDVRLLWQQPDLICGDYDGDGEKEAALVLLGGHGAGIFVEELLLIEEGEDSLEIVEFAKEDYLAQIQERLIWNWEPKQEQLTCSLDGKPLGQAWDLSSMMEELWMAEQESGTELSREELFEGVEFQEQIYFEAEEERLLLKMSGGYRLSCFGSLYYGEFGDPFPKIEAEIRVEEGAFVLDNLTVSGGEPIAGAEAEEKLEGLYLVASVPEENCYLYCYQPGGELFFKFRGKRSRIENVRLDLWTMPQIACGDYDGDGEKEAALLWTEAHGTGVSVYKLTVAKELDGELQFFMLEQADYMKQLNERIDWKWEPEQERLSCVLDETQLEESWELKELFDNLVADAERIESTYEREDAFEGISWEEQAAFHVENGTIWLFLEGGYRLKGVGMTIHEEDTPGLRAEVFWEDGCFHLGNIEIKKGSYEYE